MKIEMEHSKYSIEFNEDRGIIEKIYRYDEDVTKDLNYNIVRDLCAYIASNYKKQIAVKPKAVLVDDGTGNLHGVDICPSCYRVHYGKNNFCSYCGQKFEY